MDEEVIWIKPRGNDFPIPTVEKCVICGRPREFFQFFNYGKTFESPKFSAYFRVCYCKEHFSEPRSVSKISSLIDKLPGNGLVVVSWIGLSIFLLLLARPILDTLDRKNGAGFVMGLCVGSLVLIMGISNIANRLSLSLLEKRILTLPLLPPTPGLEFGYEESSNRIWVKFQNEDIAKEFKNILDRGY